MKIISVVLCKYVEIGDDGSYILHSAGFSEVSFKQLPAIYEVTVFYSVWRELSEPEKHQIFLAWEHEKYSFKETGGDFSFEKNEKITTGIYTHYGISIKEPGLHFIHIVIDNSRACSLPLMVKLRT